jgi:AmmeMemoRadiSam system protein B
MTRFIAPTITLLVGVALIIYLQIARPVENEFVSSSLENTLLSTDFALSYSSFFQSTQSATIKPLGSPQVLILPHHELVSQKVADTYTSLPKSYDRVVLIGPDHQNQASCPIVFPLSGFQTYAGPLLPDSQLLSQLKSQTICPQDSLFMTEHSLALHMPFIRHYLPDAQIVPLMLSPIQDFESLSRLSDHLSGLDNTLFIISIDFSHYLSIHDTRLRDQETLGLIHNRDFARILSLTSDHLDSPGSLVLGLLLADKLGLSHTNISYYGDSSKLPNPPVDQTSYLIIGFESSHPEDIELVFGGDIMLGRSVQQMTKKNADNSWPFRHIASYTSQADLFIANLESPFATPCPDVSGGFSFCADTRFVAGLTFAGLDIATLANNHISNHGMSGINTTINLLDSVGIATIGRQNIHTVDIKGLKIAFLGFNDIGSNLSPISASTPEFVAESISQASKQADFVIATFHWGEEYKYLPNSRQKLLAQTAVKAGADLVVGHHPHWVQSSEYLDGVPVFYSLGNTVFDQMWSEETRVGALLRVVLRSGQVHGHNLVFTRIYDYGQPRFIAPQLHML